MAENMDYEDKLKEIAKDKKWSDERVKEELEKISALFEGKTPSKTAAEKIAELLKK